MAETVVIIGAGFAGIGTAHKLLKYTTPKVKDLKVILISPSTHHYWNIAAVRGILPDEIGDEELFHDIQNGFDKYSKDKFEFILGTATGIDTASNSIQVDVANHAKTITYTQLVIATGSSYPGQLPFTTVGTYEDSLGALHSLQKNVRDAKSIVIAGAGPTGVETAAELGYTYGESKQVTLIIGGDAPLPILRPEIGKTAAMELGRLQVKILQGVRVASLDKRGGQVSITLSDGRKVEADLFLPLYGMRPNTRFLPAQFLDEQGSLNLDKTLRVTGLDNVWGVGDAGNLEPKQLIYAERQALHLADNLGAVLTGNSDSVKELRPVVTPQVFVTLGKKKGTGQYNWVKVPSFVVNVAKGKTLFTEKASGLIAGKNIVRSAI
ncbi:hypothetical protein EDB81DRAFT_787716 [Dactylonectria macrodidyma]|uniref:FAD/NAD(P)-binding domain-containing protein n=1 Tax=Dactylonectria macrodidyma TaxID=307937 RepID=A0A9P9F778_9HYPO|nr:hypothetical protein EDB81DRAFT_787716 [Dactylonectria macrodidyma]